MNYNNNLYNHLIPIKPWEEIPCQKTPNFIENYENLFPGRLSGQPFAHYQVNVDSELGNGNLTNLQTEDKRLKSKLKKTDSDHITVYPDSEGNYSLPLELYQRVKPKLPKLGKDMSFCVSKSGTNKAKAGIIKYEQLPPLYGIKKLVKVDKLNDILSSLDDKLSALFLKVAKKFSKKRKLDQMKDLTREQACKAILSKRYHYEIFLCRIADNLDAIWKYIETDSITARILLDHLENIYDNRELMIDPDEDNEYGVYSRKRFVERLRNEGKLMDYSESITFNLLRPISGLSVGRILYPVNPLSGLYFTWPEIKNGTHYKFAPILGDIQEVMYLLKYMRKNIKERFYIPPPLDLSQGDVSFRKLSEGLREDMSYSYYVSHGIISIYSPIKANTMYGELKKDWRYSNLRELYGSMWGIDLTKLQKLEASEKNRVEIPDLEAEVIVSKFDVDPRAGDYVSVAAELTKSEENQAMTLMVDHYLETALDEGIFKKGSFYLLNELSRDHILKDEIRNWKDRYKGSFATYRWWLEITPRERFDFHRLVSESVEEIVERTYDSALLTGKGSINLSMGVLLTAARHLATRPD